MNEGAALQLARVLTLLRAAQAAALIDLGQLRTAAAALPIPSRCGVWQSAGTRLWLEAPVVKFDGWRNRIVSAPR